MTNEDLSRLWSRDLPEDEARALEDRIAADPALAKRWRDFRATMEALDALPSEMAPPPLRIRQPTRASWSRYIPWAVAAMAAIWALIPRSGPVLVLADGGQLVEGDVSVLAADAIVDVDGTAWISVEPRTGVARVEGPEGDMQRSTWMAGLAGAAVTVLVYEGTAVVKASPGAEPVVVHAGEKRVIGQPPAAAPATPEQRAADVARLEEELTKAKQDLAAAQFEGALTRGQLTALQGNPSEWPTDVPARARPERFQAELEARLKDHPELKVDRVDCDEYPCIAAVKYLGDAESDEWAKPIADDARAFMKDLYGSDGLSMSVNTSRFQDADESAAYVIFGATEPDVGEDVGTRTSYRIDGMVKDLGSELHPDPPATP